MISDIPAKARFQIIHGLVSRNSNLLKVTMLCELAGVSRSGYYNWAASESKRIQREGRDRKDFELILEAYHHRGYAKGGRSIYMNLLHRRPEPVVMNLKKIRRL